MEPVSAVAAVVQLTGQALMTLRELYQLYRSSRKAEANISKYAKRLEIMMNVLQETRNDSSVQMPRVTEILASCTETLNTLNTKLAKLAAGLSRTGLRKVHNVVLTALQEPELKSLFRSMDSHKLDLMLALQHGNSKVWL